MMTENDLETACLIREFEEQVLRLYGEGLVSGTTHTCLGQEPVAVAMASVIRPDDYVFSTHRGHGHYLALNGDLTGLLAEIMGREGAVAHGHGGSQHIRHGRFFTTGVQGAGVGTAVGVALRLQHLRGRDVAFAFTGDGTWGEGLVYEALNIASLRGLPLVVVSELNGIAQSTPISASLAGSIPERARALGVSCHTLDGFDVVAARQELAPRVAAVRRGDGPLVVCWSVPRLGPHSKGDDTRVAHEMESVRSQDWWAWFAAERPDALASASERARVLVTAAIADVSARPPSKGAPPHDSTPALPRRE